MGESLSYSYWLSLKLLCILVSSFTTHQESLLRVSFCWSKMALNPWPFSSYKLTKIQSTKWRLQLLMTLRNWQIPTWLWLNRVLPFPAMETVRYGSVHHSLSSTHLDMNLISQLLKNYTNIMSLSEVAEEKKRKSNYCLCFFKFNHNHIRRETLTITIQFSGFFMAYTRLCDFSSPRWK